MSDTTETTPPSTSGGELGSPFLLQRGRRDGHRRPIRRNRYQGVRPHEPYAFDGEVIHVSVLFADLRGFTAVAERLAPRRMASLLNRYFTAMVDVILARQGMVQDF